MQVVVAGQLPSMCSAGVALCSLVMRQMPTQPGSGPCLYGLRVMQVVVAGQLPNMCSAGVRVMRLGWEANAHSALNIASANRRPNDVYCTNGAPAGASLHYLHVTRLGAELA